MHLTMILDSYPYIVYTVWSIKQTDL